MASAQTLALAKAYTDEVLATHVDAVDPHPQYARIVDTLGQDTEGRIILAQPGDTFPSPELGSILISQGGVFIADQTGTAWVQLGNGPLPVDSTPPTTPGNLRTTAVTTTSVSLAWNAATDAGSGVAGYDVAQGAAGAFLPNGPGLVKQITGLTPGTAYTFRVRAVDAAGNTSAIATLQVSTTSPADTSPPGSPPNFHTTNVGATSVSLAWSAAVDTGGGTIARYEVATGTGAYTSVGTSLSTVRTGLTPGTAYTFRVRAVDTSNNISPVAQLNVSTVTQTVTVTTKMGVPDNGNDHGFTNWDFWRVYNLNASGSATVASVLGKGAVRVGVTDQDASVTSTSRVATLRTFLTTLYGKTGAPSKNQTLLLDFANGNEIDRADKAIAPAARGSATRKAFIDTYAAYKAVTDDFDNASLWFDATANQVRGGASNDVVNADTWDILSDTSTAGIRLCDLLDGLAGSYYPPGRKDSPMTAGSYTGNSAPSAIIDPYMELHALSGVTRAAIWEFGIPILPSDATKRPTYVAAFADYWLQSCVDNGIEPVGAAYWDQQSSGAGSPRNLLVDDNPATATAWRNAPANF